MGDEGGFAPSINSTTEGLDLIVAAISARPASTLRGAQCSACLHARQARPSALASMGEWPHKTQGHGA